MAQVATENERILSVEDELKNYTFYKAFLNLATKNQLSICPNTKERISSVKIIEHVINKLPPNLAEFTNYRYFDGLTMEEVADKMNVSLSSCYRYRRKVIEKYHKAFGL